MNSVTVFIPGLLDSPAFTVQKKSALAQLLARAKAECIPTVLTFEQQAATLFNLPLTPAVSVAALRAHAAGLPAEQGYWLCADPIHLQADVRAVFLQAIDTISEQECAMLSASLQPLLQTEQLEFYAPTGTEWYCCSENPIELQAASPAALAGKSIAEQMPVGATQNFWRRLMTEVQMMLHTHPINIARREQGQLTIDSLWWWGAGSLPTMVPIWDQVWCDNTFIKGLAKQSAATMSCTADFVYTSGRHLYVAELADETLFTALWQLLKKGDLNEVTLLLNSTYRYYISAQSVRPWWSRWG